MISLPLSQPVSFPSYFLLLSFWGGGVRAAEQTSRCQPSTHHNDWLWLEPQQHIIVSLLNCGSVLALYNHLYISCKSSHNSGSKCKPVACDLVNTGPVEIESGTKFCSLYKAGMNYTDKVVKQWFNQWLFTSELMETSFKYFPPPPPSLIPLPRNFRNISNVINIMYTQSGRLHLIRQTKIVREQ